MDELLNDRQGPCPSCGRNLYPKGVLILPGEGEGQPCPGSALTLDLLPLAGGMASALPGDASCTLHQGREDVYLVHLPFQRLFKIGSSQCVRRRLGSLRQQHGQVESIALCQGAGRSLEMLLHAALSAFRAEGREYYWPSCGIVHLFARLGESCPPGVHT